MRRVALRTRNAASLVLASLITRGMLGEQSINKFILKEGI